MEWAMASAGINQQVQIGQNGGGIWDIVTDGSLVYFGIGNSWPTEGSRGIFGSIDVSDPCNTLQYIGVLDEQGFGEMEICANGNVIIPGVDPHFGDGWDAANVYLWNGESLNKIRNKYHTAKLIGKTTTDENGNYCFNNLKATNYDVKFIPPPGYMLTNPTQTSDFVFAGQGNDGESDPQLSSGIVSVGGPNLNDPNNIASNTNCWLNGQTTNRPARNTNCH